HCRSLVSFDSDVVTAGLRVKLHPVRRRWPADETQPVLLQVKENGIADHIALVVACDELLRLVDFESFETVDGKIGEQTKSVRPVDIEIRHVVRLVQQGTG